MGIGNGLRNKISASIHDMEKVKKYISSGYISITVLSIIISLAGVVFLSVVNLNKLFNVPDNSLSNTSISIVAITTFIGIMLQFVVRIVTSILYALQKNTLANTAMLITNGSVLVFLIFGSNTIYSSDTKIVYLSNKQAKNITAVNSKLV